MSEAGAGDVSESVIAGGGNNLSAPYAMLITERAQKRKARTERGEVEPHQKHIGFATSRPGIDPKLYKNRWGIETGYRMIEGALAKTHSKNPAVRLLYFVYSVAIYNSWAVANAVLEYTTGIHNEKESLMSQQHTKNMMLSCCLFDCYILPEPLP